MSYDTPDDRLVWDVGHQAYPHKVLTGRREQLHTIKQHDGLAPFPLAPRATTTPSASAIRAPRSARRSAWRSPRSARASGRRAVAVIGDGAMSAGMAFEALNHAGSLPVDLLVVLNDNDMSISENVGALSNYLARVMSGPSVRAAARKRQARAAADADGARAWRAAPRNTSRAWCCRARCSRRWASITSARSTATISRRCCARCATCAELHGPQLLHVVTRKGKGYAPAEADPITWHGPGPFDPVSGTILKEKAGTPSYSQVFGHWLCDMAERDPRIVAITPAMREGSGLVEFSRRFPERYFDVAIAEQHAVTFAAGLACEGMRPVVAIYSTFLQRGYDQLIHDVALQNLPVRVRASIAPAWSAATARPTTAATICRSCAASPTW